MVKVEEKIIKKMILNNIAITLKILNAVQLIRAQILKQSIENALNSRRVLDA